MPAELNALLSNCDTLAQKATGAVASAARDIRKEIVYLAGELNIAGSSDAREAVFAKITKRLAKLRDRLQGLTDALNAKAANAAAGTTEKAVGKLVRISEKHEKAIIDAVANIGQRDMAAVMTQAMASNIVTSLREATTAAFREQAVSGLTQMELQEVLKSKWLAVAKDPKALQFTDKGGRLWDTNDYVNMNVRTNAMRIYNETLVQNIAKTTGSDLVMVSRGGDINCRLCFPWEGRILSISGKTPGFPSYADALKAGLFHPNCVHTLEPVDEEFDADEIALQRQFKPPQEMKPDEMDDQRYEMDVARKMLENPSLTATQAKVAVDRENLETSIRQGLIAENAQAIVDGLTDEQVQALCKNGNPPQFLPAKDNGGDDGWNKGSKGGTVFMHTAAPTTEKLLAATEVGDGKPVEAFEFTEKPKLEKRFVGNTDAAKEGLKRLEALRAKCEEEKDKASKLSIALANNQQSADTLTADYPEINVKTVAAFSKGISALQQTVKTCDYLLKKVQAEADWLQLLDPPESAEAQAEQDAKVEKRMKQCESLVDSTLQIFSVAGYGIKTPEKLIADAQAQIDKKGKEEAQKLLAAVNDRISQKDTIRKERIDKGNVIEALAADANLERKKHYADVSTFRQIFRAMRTAEGRLDEIAQSFRDSVHVGNYSLARNFANDFDAEWKSATPYGSYDEAHQQLRDTFERAKRFLEERTGRTGEDAVKQEEQAKKALTEPLSSYIFPDKVTADIFEGGQALGGSTGAKLVEIDGRKYVMKRGSNTSDAHLESEMAANAAYRAAGVRVPDFRTYKVDGETVSLAEFIPGTKTLGEYLDTATPAERTSVLRQIRKGYALDALLANTDVLGTGGDNILVDEKGQAWRIDNGGALGFRAQGGKKNAALFEARTDIDMLWTMRGLYPNGKKSPFELPFAKAVVNDEFTTAKILRDAQGIDFDAAVNALPKEERRALEFPLSELKNLVATSKNYDAGGYADEAQNIAIDAGYNFYTHTDVREVIPENAFVKPREQSEVDPVFRGGESKTASEYVSGDESLGKTITARIQDFIETDGGTKDADPSRYQIVVKWNDSQAWNSWGKDDDGIACRAKILEYRARGLNPDPRSGGLVGSNTRKDYKARGQNGELYGIYNMADPLYIQQWDRYQADPAAYERDFKAFMQYKGACLSVIRQIDLPGKDGEDYIVCRVETGHDGMGLDKYQGKFCKVASASCESSAVLSPFGHEGMTVRRLPLSRINSCYIFGRSKDRNQLLMGDQENEVTFDLNGDTPVYYIGSIEKFGTSPNGGMPREYERLEQCRAEFLAAEKRLKPKAEDLPWAN